LSEEPAAPPKSIACPDCGAANPPGAELCAECNHPLDVPDTRRTVKESVPRLERPERPERIGPNVTSFGYRPTRSTAAGADPGASSVLWLLVGLAALVAVLVAAIQIARQPPPLAMPNASKAQLASAESLRVILRADSTAVEPNVVLGNLFYDTGNFGEAIPYYKRALRKDPSLIDVQVDLAVAYHNGGDLELARQTLERAVQAAPDHPVAQFDLGVVYQTLGKKDEARAHYLKAQSLAHPTAMDAVIRQLLATLDSAGTVQSALPPGHPAVP
jgi:tetratricopeptide (TPR) repeat protein